MMALLYFAARLYPRRTALVYEQQRYTFARLYRLAYRLALYLKETYRLAPGAEVALLLHNAPAAVLLMPALARLGVDVTLLNTDLTPHAVRETLCRSPRCALLVAEQPLPDLPVPLLLSHEVERLTSIGEDLTPGGAQQAPARPPVKLPKPRRIPKITVLTGGSGGHFTQASRRPSPTMFLPPLAALFRNIGIHRYSSVYIPLPLYHGFGLATLWVSLAAGKKTVLAPKLTPRQTGRLLNREKIEVMPVVPILISRLLSLPEHNAQTLPYLRCLICGGDRLDASVAAPAARRLGPILFNLFGTSEAGFFLLATPPQVLAYDPPPIGAPIKGVKCRVKDPDANGVGELWVRSSWAMQGRRNRWQPTGDLVRRTADGLFCYIGRKDRMVVCGGENVYPEHIEQVALSFPGIAAALATAHPDERTGRHMELLAEPLEPLNDAPVRAEELREYLRSRLSRSEMPHRICLGAVPRTATGKVKRS